MATIRDIARAAKVSPATVSRVLNHDTSLRVAVSTRLRVMEAAEKLEYVPKRQRKENGAGQTPAPLERLNFAIADWYTEAELAEDPYYLYQMTAVEKACVEKNINTYRLINLDGTYTAAVDCAMDGLIAIGRFAPRDIEILRHFTQNIVFLDSSPDMSTFDSVQVNSFLGARLAMEHLYDLGHRRIAFMGGRVVVDHGEWGEDHRRSVYDQFMKEKGLFEERLIYEGEKISFREGSRLAQEMLLQDELPSALFVANDTMATGVLSVLAAKEIRVPERLSIVGYNDIAAVKHLSPPLTTVHIPLDEIAACAVELLRQNITCEKSLPYRVQLPAKLVVRASTARLPLEK